ncbi:MAG TPA: hypothetical protein VKB78_02745, partial [Pirellulales bacterium]|nr:hypothetical protein [Pirellulales bacterium]
FQLPSTFAHILHNAGFGDPDELRPLVEAWESLYDLVQPDLLLAEHGPTAILASMAREMARIAIGTGFTCPPDISPLPDWRPYLNNDPSQLARDEDRVRTAINDLLTDWGEPPLVRAMELYSRLDETLLNTFAELDHFGPRKGAIYRGTATSGIGKSFEWPRGNGPKVFGYLKPFAALEPLLANLVERKLPTVIYAPEVNPQLTNRFQSETFQFASRPIDLEMAGQWCDVAILNATHGATAALLLAGKPSLQIPLYLEQQLTADNVVRMGAGLTAEANRPDRAIEQLEHLLVDDRYAAAASKFSHRYADFNRLDQIDVMVDRIERLIPQTVGGSCC